MCPRVGRKFQIFDLSEYDCPTIFSEDILAWIPQRTKGETAAKRMSLYTTSILMHGLTVIHGLHGQYLISESESDFQL